MFTSIFVATAVAATIIATVKARAMVKDFSNSVPKVCVLDDSVAFHPCVRI